jgi:hypothetical protein
MKLLQRVLPAARELFEELPAATVLAFVGQRIDPLDRSRRHDVGDMERALTSALRDELAPLHLPIIYTSAAFGAELIFIETALELGADVNVVLPFDRGDFVQTSVAVAGVAWVQRFDAALASVSRILEAPHVAIEGAEA